MKSRVKIRSTKKNSSRLSSLKKKKNNGVEEEMLSNCLKAGGNLT